MAIYVKNCRNILGQKTAVVQFDHLVNIITLFVILSEEYVSLLGMPISQNWPTLLSAKSKYGFLPASKNAVEGVQSSSRKKLTKNNDDYIIRLYCAREIIHCNTIMQNSANKESILYYCQGDRPPCFLPIYSYIMTV